MKQIKQEYRVNLTFEIEAKEAPTEEGDDHAYSNVIMTGDGYDRDCLNNIEHDRCAPQPNEQTESIGLQQGSTSPSAYDCTQENEHRLAITLDFPDLPQLPQRESWPGHLVKINKKLPSGAKRLNYQVKIQNHG